VRWHLPALVLGVAVFGGGCGSASSVYTPKLVARGELTLRYDDGVEVYAGRKRLADAPGFGGLASYVSCVPRALEHAEAAESDGAAAIGTGFAGAVLGVSGLGGLAGLAFLDTDKPLAFSLLGSGVAVGLVGITLALISRGLKNSANGHATDAVNYYNDDVGFHGGSCSFEKLEPRRVVVPAAIPEPVQEPPAPPPEPLPEPAEEIPIDPDAPSPDAPEPAEPPRATDAMRNDPDSE
jgi:hypothetical protein